MNIIKLSGQRILLNFKSLGSNVVTLILLFIIPTLFCVSALVIVPLGYDFQLIMSGSVMLIGYVTYGSIAGSFRRSTLNKNTNLTSAIKWTDNLATIGTMIILSVLVALYVVAILSLFEITGALIYDFDYTSSDYHMNLWQVLGLAQILYNVLLITIITYSTSYLFQGFFDSDMMFFTLAILMLIFLMIFGATFNKYLYYSANVAGPTPTNWDTPFPQWFFIPSLLFPFYAPAQMLSLQGDLITEQVQHLSAILPSLLHPEPNSLQIWTFISGENAWKWNILWFVPYFHIVFWWMMGFVYKKYGTPRTAQ